MRDPADWDVTKGMLAVPPLDAGKLRPRRVAWKEWLPPVLLLQCRGADGRTVRLSDFGSAGEAGTPFLSWLPVRGVPEATPFSQTNPLRTGRPARRRTR